MGEDDIKRCSYCGSRKIEVEKTEIIGVSNKNELELKSCLDCGATLVKMIGGYCHPYNKNDKGIGGQVFLGYRDVKNSPSGDKK